MALLLVIFNSQVNVKSIFTIMSFLAFPYNFDWSSIVNMNSSEK